MIKLIDILNESKEKLTYKTESKEAINESAILRSLLSLIAAGALRFLAGPIINLTFNAIGNVAKKLKNIFNPSDILKLDKMFAKDKEFSKDILGLLSPDGEFAKKNTFSGISDAVVELPSFKRLFNKFCDENNIADNDKDYFYREVKSELSKNLAFSAPDIVKDVKRKHKELKDMPTWSRGDTDVFGKK